MSSSPPSSPPSQRPPPSQQSPPHSPNSTLPPGPYQGPPPGVKRFFLEKPKGAVPSLPSGGFAEAGPRFSDSKKLKMCDKVAKVNRDGKTAVRSLLLTGDLLSICTVDWMVKRINHVADITQVFFHRAPLPEFLFVVKGEPPINLRCPWASVQTISNARYFFTEPPSGLECIELDAPGLRQKAKELFASAPPSNFKNPQKQLDQVKANSTYQNDRRSATQKRLEGIVGDAHLKVAVASRGESMGIRFSDVLVVNDVVPGGAGERSGANAFVGKRVTHVAYRPVYSLPDAMSALQNRATLEIPLHFADVLPPLQPGEDELTVVKGEGEAAGMIVSADMMLEGVDGPAERAGASPFVGRKIIAALDRPVAKKGDLIGLLQQPRITFRFAPPDGYVAPQPDTESMSEAQSGAPSAETPQPLHGTLPPFALNTGMLPLQEGPGFYSAQGGPEGEGREEVGRSCACCLHLDPEAGRGSDRAPLSVVREPSSVPSRSPPRTPRRGTSRGRGASFEEKKSNISTPGKATLDVQLLQALKVLTDRQDNTERALVSALQAKQSVVETVEEEGVENEEAGGGGGGDAGSVILHNKDSRHTFVEPLLPVSLCSDESLEKPSFRTHRPIPAAQRGRQRSPEWLG